MRQIPDPENAFPAEVLKQLQIALKEIGEIKPWWDEECQCWTFEHPAYTESYGGETPKEVIAGYKYNLAKLLQWRMEGTLAPWVEEQITGRGGFRKGAGRPKREPTKQMRVPDDIAEVISWLKSDPSHIEKVRRLMQSS